MTDRDPHDELLSHICEEMMGQLLEDWQKCLASAMEGMSPESLFGPELGRILGQMGRQHSREPSETAYRMLGLQKSASDQEVKTRYRELVKRLHPDVAGSETEHLFKRVQAAYEEIEGERGWRV